jgi:hypothetical protein
VFGLVVFILLEVASPSRRIISAPIHSPTLVCHSGPSNGIRASYGSLLTLTTVRSKMAYHKWGSGRPHFDGKDYQMWQR